MSPIDEARTALQKGNRIEARNILANIVSHEPQNAAAWSFLAEVLDDPQQILFCRQRAQSIVSTKLSPPIKPSEPASSIVSQSLASRLKKCPYCAEEIQDEAIVCRFCGRDLPTLQQPAITNTRRVEVEKAIAETKFAISRAGTELRVIEQEGKKTPVQALALGVVMLLAGAYVGTSRTLATSATCLYVMGGICILMFLAALLGPNVPQRNKLAELDGLRQKLASLKSELASL